MTARARVVLPLGLALAVGVLFGRMQGGGSPELIFLDVGQGDCTVLRSEHEAILIDLGPKTATYDAGASVVVPKLRAMGVSPRLLLLTHPDTDHVGGLAAVHRAFPGAQVAISGAFRHYKHLIDQMRDAGLSSEQIVWLTPRSSVEFGGFTLDLTCPEWHTGENDNEGSLVTRVSHGKASALLMGDAGFSVEYRLLPQGGWQSQILKVGHHGSRFSTSAEWLKAVNPQWAVVSCGKRNSYGHPHRALLQRLHDAKAEALRTDQRGDIAFREGEEGFELER